MIIRLKQYILFFILVFSVYSCNDPQPEHIRGMEDFSFAFLTDIHVQPEKNADLGFKQAIDTVNSLEPDFVITGGDLIMDASEQSEPRADSLYDLYTELSGLLNMPVYNTIASQLSIIFKERFSDDTVY
ncbi:MAG TPA: hypothetical protein DEQ09_06025 [Bacteroidales bacterium]|nr:hypothetical protein [Bacteroidales bacterium]